MEDKKIGVMLGQSDFFVYLCAQKVFAMINIFNHNVFTMVNTFAQKVFIKNNKFTVKVK